LLKTMMMPLAAGGAIAFGFVVYSGARRWLEARTLESDMARRLNFWRAPEHERDPIGPPDSRPSKPVHPVRVSTEAEVAAVIGAEWPLPPAPDALAPTVFAEPAPRVDSDIEAWLADAEFPDEETAPTQPGMRFEREALDTLPDGVPGPRGSSSDQ